VIKVRGIDHVAINVKDLNRSLEFYTKILGLSITKREYSKPGIEYFLDCGTSLVGLIQVGAGSKPAPTHLLQDEGVGGNHVAFRVKTTDFDRTVEALENAGVKILFSKKREKSWSVYFLDPDGNKLEITAWPEED